MNSFNESQEYEQSGALNSGENEAKLSLKILRKQMKIRYI